MRPADRPRGRQRVLATAVLLLSTFLAISSGDGGARGALAASFIKPPAGTAVRDPAPAPGGVLGAGEHRLAASVTGISSARLRFTVDGQPVEQATVDADGDLGNRRGVDVHLGPGRHTIGVEDADTGPLRSWDVTVVDLEVDDAGDEPAAVAIRLAGSRAGSRPVVLANPDVVGHGAVGVAVAAQLEGVLLPAAGAISPQVLAAIRDVRAELVILIGGPDAISEVVAAEVGGAGVEIVRVGGGSAADVALSAADWIADLPLQERPATGPAVVVGPSAPLQAALAAAGRAAELRAPLLLAHDDATGEDIAAIAQRAVDGEYVLLSDRVAPEVRRGLAGALDPAMALNLDPFLPQAASEVVIVEDGASPGSAVMAAQAALSGRAVVFGDGAGADYVAAHRPGRVLRVTGSASSGGIAEAADAYLRAWAGGAAAPGVQSVIDDRTRRPSITYLSDRPLQDADIHVELLGHEWPGQTVVAGDRVVWTATPRPRLPEPLEPQRSDSSASITITAQFTSLEGTTRYVSADGRVTIDPVASMSRDGFVVAGGSSDVVGTGPLRTFSVAIEPTTGLSLNEVTAQIEEILLDERGWTADGSVSLQRIGAPNSARIKVVVATPATVDARCGAVGLRTGGRVSCWDGFRAMLNLDRWNYGVVPFHADIDVYREYLVNHEVGHGLGHGHVFCPRPGALAPVMVQQTGGLGGCQANGWPFPHAGGGPGDAPAPTGLELLAPSTIATG